MFLKCTVLVSDTGWWWITWSLPQAVPARAWPEVFAALHEDNADTLAQLQAAFRAGERAFLRGEAEVTACGAR